MTISEQKTETRVNKFFPITLIVLIVLGLGFAFFLISQRINNTVSFEDIEIDVDENALLEFTRGYVSLPSLSADSDSIEAVIGGIAIRSKDKNGEEIWSWDMRLRPSKDLLFSKIVDEKLYTGIVSATVNFGGGINIVSGSVTSEDLAEVTIRNQLIAGYKNPSEIPYQALSKIRTTPDKEYFFLESVVVTDITFRRFSKKTGDGKVQGMTFGANGNVYSRKDVLKSQKILSFRPIYLLDLQASEAGDNNDIKKLISKSRRHTLSKAEAAKLVHHLREQAKDIAPVSIPLIEPPSRLPERLIGLEAKVWYEHTWPQKQTSNNRCWAAVTAMMLSWNKKRLVSESEAVVSLGTGFESVYERDAPLPWSYKLSLLQASGMNYRAPQSYTQQGLISLLQDHGPVWFTLDREFGRHATVLTGVFIEKDSGEYWVAYIDPIDGELKADTYVSYMRRYEAPAYRANEEGLDVVMTEENLDIQVVHW